MGKQIEFKIDGKAITAVEGQNLVNAAKENGIFIPSLCYYEHIDPPLGTCRVCTCKINESHVPACMIQVQKGMEVSLDTVELNNIRKSIVEMMFADHRLSSMLHRACPLLMGSFKKGGPKLLSPHNPGRRF